MRKFSAAAMGSVVALVGFAGAANASATVDLIWIDVTDTACIDDGRRDCLQLGTTLSSVAVTDNITLGVIITAGPGGAVGGGVSVDYSAAIPTLSVSGFQRLTTTGPLPYLPDYALEAQNNQVGWVQNINAFGIGVMGAGIGLPAGQTAYLGTVTFHNTDSPTGTFEIKVGTNGPAGTDGIGNLALQEITATTTFNSAFVTVTGPNDVDGDGVADAIDNCSEASNPGQADTDADNCGNLCDADYDNNGLVGFPDFGSFATAYASMDEEKCHIEPISGCTVGYPDFGFFGPNYGSAPGPSGTTAGTTACP
jgi:hypothetical protein